MILKTHFRCKLWLNLLLLSAVHLHNDRTLWVQSFWKLNGFWPALQLQLSIELGQKYLACLSFAFLSVLVFPVIYCALRFNVDELVFDVDVPLASHHTRYALSTCSSLLVILLAASYIPGIWAALQFVGVTAGVLILFIFPASIALRLVMLSYVRGNSYPMYASSRVIGSWIGCNSQLHHNNENIPWVWEI